ncbi:DUF202 domain-containing protein [Bythopirellula polymerisocia]|uniref:DUF202 domain-containing protein n=1 Tax=Bythopirellula polymerisocia TaxID=2528003 RepID=A0A5C6CR83_9BACT|nr:DUF202 domain-containing protein [Bythopirellula polymerisocia]TWU26064.1 hypothetical protein Pla144_32810 [Bythopirellula polymerisocia]
MLTKEGDSAVRDQLALMRTRMANERTLLAYLRTALMLLATGGTILKLLAETLPLMIVGWLIIVGGITVGGLGVLRFRHFKKHYLSSE